MRQQGGNIRGNQSLGAFATEMLKEVGVTVTLPDGSTLMATLMQNERDLTRSRPGDALAPEKRPFVWLFGPEAQGKVSEGMKLLVDGIHYLVDPPLHPQYEGGQLVYLAVSSYKF